jgi:hypothetical protein
LPVNRGFSTLTVGALTVDRLRLVTMKPSSHPPLPLAGRGRGWCRRHRGDPF